MHYTNDLKQKFSTAKIYDYNRFSETYFIEKYRCHVVAKFCVFVDVDPCKLSTLYWLPKLHKKPIIRNLLLILVCVLLHSCLCFRRLASLR